MGRWHDRIVPEGELGVRSLTREFGAGAFPRLGPVRSTAFRCKSCGLRFPVPACTAGSRRGSAFVACICQRGLAGRV